MLYKIIKNESEDTSFELYNDLYIFYIENKDDLAEFIKLHYRGRFSETHKIPFKKWFVYYTDDSGDSVWSEFFLLEEYKEELLKSIIDATLLYKQLSDIKTS